MDIQLQGINPVFSSSLLLLFIAGVLLFSWWSYSYLKTVSTAGRWGLSLLRGASLILLVLLLLNPFLELEETEFHNPQVVVYLDDSQSMSIQRGDYDGWETYRSMIESYGLDGIDEVDVRYFRFGGVVDPADSHEELQLNEGTTHMDEVMRHLRDQSEHVVAALLFSDGIVTRGRDPLFSARELEVPLFTIPVGDTTKARDVAISEVMTNETGYVDTRQLVEITLTQEGFPGETTNLQLRKDGDIIDSEEIEFDSESSTHRLNFEIGFEEGGLHSYEVYVLELDGEVTAENNLYPFSVNVIDEQTDIYHLAFEIHPDVKMVRSVLGGDRNIELHPYTWIGGRFSEHRQFDAGPDDIDLLVIHGAIPPGAGLGEDLLEQVPAIQFVTPGMAPDQLSGAVIPLRAFDPGSMLDIQLLPVESNHNHPVLEMEQIELVEFTRLPTLSIHYANFELPATATVLYRARYAGSETDIPVLIVEETGQLRRALLLAHGWFAYQQATNNITREFTKQLFSNLGSWTSTSPEREHLRIGPAKQVYQQGEEIHFRADLTGETGEPETEAVIEVVIIDEEDEEQVYTMRHRSRGNYQLPVRAMAAGNYEYRAEARKAGRVIDSARGEFSVTSSTLEFLNTQRNDELLRQLAEVTGGAFLSEISSDQLVDELIARNLLEHIEERKSAFRFLHQHIIWFILVLLFLGAEWLLRRKYSLP